MTADETGRPQQTDGQENSDVDSSTIPAEDDPVFQEALQREYLRGWREGFEASETDQVTRAYFKPELADRIVIERLTQALTQLRQARP